MTNREMNLELKELKSIADSDESMTIDTIKELSDNRGDDDE